MGTKRKAVPLVSPPAALSGGNGIGTDSGTVERQPHPSDPNRWKDGTVRAGNVLAVRHGGRRRRPLADPEASEVFVTWAADLGDDLTAGERVILRRAAEADAVCTSAYDYLQNTRESWTSRRVQVALQTLSIHAGTVFKSASLLGLRRRAKPVPSLAAVLAEVEEHR